MRPAQAVIKVGFRASSPGQGAGVKPRRGLGVEPQAPTRQTSSKAGKQPAGLASERWQNPTRVFTSKAPHIPHAGLCYTRWLGAIPLDASRLERCLRTGAAAPLRAALGFGKTHPRGSPVGAGAWGFAPCRTLPLPDQIAAHKGHQGLHVACKHGDIRRIPRRQLPARRFADGGGGALRCDR